MSDKDKSDALYRKHLRIMIFINICPIFHWMRNNRRILNYYYYICLTEFEKVKDKDSEILDMLYQDLLASKTSFDSLYGIANFMNSKEYRELVRNAPEKRP
ncbi:MAG: hypothetical protein K6G75_05870 [Lachnospiraceae bacterium]|nr:hypothetical protein [Lachnospiraceae bacterium]